MYRQGDVLLIPCPAVPDEIATTCNAERPIVIAHGERTGHAHRILARQADAAEFCMTGKNVCFLRAHDEVELVHEEHGTLAIPPGTYEVRHQHRVHPSGAPIPAAYND